MIYKLDKNGIYPEYFIALASGRPPAERIGDAERLDIYDFIPEDINRFNGKKLERLNIRHDILEIFHENYLILHTDEKEQWPYDAERFRNFVNCRIIYNNLLNRTLYDI